MNPAIHGNVQGAHKILDFNNVRNSMATISRSAGYHLMLNGYQSTPQVSTRSYFEFNVKVCDISQTSNLQYNTILFYTQVRGSDRCKLFCRVQDSSTYYLLGASVVDGTQCGADTFDACVEGQCVAAGCDHVLGSGMKLGL